MGRILKPEAKEILDKVKGIKADENFINQEFERRNLKKELSRNTFEIWYDHLGRCFVSAHYSTLSSCAEIACKKKLIMYDIVGNNDNYTKN